MPFKKGQVTNPVGRPKGPSVNKSFKDALLLAVNRAEGNKIKLALIAEALVEKACAGDVSAINAVADRMDGKPTQVIAGDRENPLTIMVEAGKSIDAKLERLIAGRARKAQG